MEGHFSNHLRIGHNGYEFIFEFAQCNVGEDGMVHTRIITAPVYAKAFLEVIKESVAQYEAEFGPIGIDGSR